MPKGTLKFSISYTGAYWVHVWIVSIPLPIDISQETDEMYVGMYEYSYSKNNLPHEVRPSPDTFSRWRMRDLPQHIQQKVRKRLWTERIRSLTLDGCM